MADSYKSPSYFSMKAYAYCEDALPDNSKYFLCLTK